MSQATKDFSGQNLQGRNFKRQNLTRASFRNADIRGVNFSDSVLEGADFTGAEAGLQRRQIVFLLLISSAISVLSAFIILSSGFEITFFFYHANSYDPLVGVTILAILSAFIVTTILRGIVYSYSMMLALGAIFISVLVLYALKRMIDTFSLTSFGISDTPFGVLSEEITLRFRAISVSAFAVVGVIAGSISLSIIGLIANPISFASTVLFSILSISIVLMSLSSRRLLILSGAVSAILWGLSIYMAIAALRKSKNQKWILDRAIQYSVMGGTNFYKADLTSADFTLALLKNTSFKRAKLLRTHWLNSVDINYANFVKTYLDSPRIRQLVAEKIGKDQSFDRLGLEGINLKDADLQNSSFVGTNLNNADLRYANLSRANLKQAQLDGVDLTGATLTGAFIEDWGITSETKLDGIKCEYVYMRVPTPDDPDPVRKPDNRNEVFEDGDFADFIRPLTDTLDLYHNQSIDPRAIAIAFKDLAENHPEAGLRIVAMEVKGEGKFLLRAQTAKAADKSELSTEYFSTYNQIKTLSESEVKTLLGEKDRRIQSLEAMVVTALQRPSFYSHVERADMVSNNPGGISQSVSGGTVYGGMQASVGDNNQQTMETNVAQASNDKHLTQADVIQLLAELEQILKAAELPEDTKDEATLYLGAAKKAVEKEEPKKELAATNLKGMAETLENASKGTESVKKTWEIVKPALEAVLPWLGVAKSFFGF